MIRKFGLMVIWFPLTGLLLINCLVFLATYDRETSTVSTPRVHTTIPLSDRTLTIQSHGTGQVLAAHIIAGDGRAELLTKFMKGTPLEPHAPFIVQLADEFNMDYRLVPAIAMCESNLGVHIPGSDSHNAWGIAVYTGQKSGAKFSDWKTGIAWVYQFLYTRFISQNVVDLREIGAIWAPPSVEKGHSWATCVETFMKQI